MRRVKICTKFRKAQLAEIIVVQAIAPCPVASDVQYSKFLAVHQRAYRHRGSMRFSVNFGYGRNSGAQHRHRIMRGEQLACQADIRKIASDRRRPLVANQTVPRQLINSPITCRIAYQ